MRKKEKKNQLKVPERHAPGGSTKHQKWRLLSRGERGGQHGIGKERSFVFPLNSFKEGLINTRLPELRTHMTVLNTIDLNHWLDFMNQSVISEPWPCFSARGALSCVPLAAFHTFSPGLNDSSYSDQ